MNLTRFVCADFLALVTSGEGASPRGSELLSGGKAGVERSEWPSCFCPFLKSLGLTVLAHEGAIVWGGVSRAPPGLKQHVT